MAGCSSSHAEHSSRCFSSSDTRPRDHDTRAGQGLDAGPLGAVARDHELAADHVPHPVPEPQQQVDALVVGQPAQREEQRLRRPRRQRLRRLDTVADLPDLVRPDPELGQRRRPSTRTR